MPSHASRPVHLSSTPEQDGVQLRNVLANQSYNGPDGLELAITALAKADSGADGPLSEPPPPNTSYKTEDGWVAVPRPREGMALDSMQRHVEVLWHQDKAPTTSLARPLSEDPDTQAADEAAMPGPLPSASSPAGVSGASGASGISARGHRSGTLTWGKSAMLSRMLSESPNEMPFTALGAVRCLPGPSPATGAAGSRGSRSGRTDADNTSHHSSNSRHGSK